VPGPQPNKLLRAARERTASRRVPGTHMSREEVAEAVALWVKERDERHRDVPFDANHLGKLERGAVRRPRPVYVAALCAVLGTTETELGLSREPAAPVSLGWDRDAVTAAVDTITRDDLAPTSHQGLTAAALVGPALTQPLQRWLTPLPEIVSAAGSAFSPPEVEAVETLVIQLHDVGRMSNGALGRKAVVAQLSELSERLRTVPSGSLTTRVTVATARLAETAASMSWDAGAHRAAQRYYVIAVQLAKLAGDDALAAVALAALGRQCYDLNRPGDGLEVVQLAQFGTRRTSSARLRSMLSTREAWAYAQRGEVQAFHRATGLAQDFYSEATDAEPCRWVRTFDLAELHGVIGARFRDLAHHDPKQACHAQDHINQALELRDPGRLRNRAFDLIGLARSYLIAAEPEQAGAIIGEALPIARQWSPGRVGVKLADFYRESEQFSAVPAIRDAREAIHDMITT
jgi:hypothetical protein